MKSNKSALHRYAHQFANWLPAFACALFAHASVAGDLSWNAARTSPAINYGGKSVSVQYSPGRIESSDSATPAISRIHANISYPSNSAVQTRLCWNGLDRCVPVAGSSFNTDAFNGLDASKPMYLMHTAHGKGPLPSPVFVRGEIIVWFTR